MRPRLLLLLFLLSASLSAGAEAYKCRLPDGRIEFRSTPCNGSSTLTVRPDEPVSAAQRQQAEREAERMRTHLEKLEAAQRADEAAERERQRNAAREQSVTPAAVTPTAQPVYVPVPVAVPAHRPAIVVRPAPKPEPPHSPPRKDLSRVVDPHNR